jgi:UDP-glucose 4-epimerase
MTLRKVPIANVAGGGDIVLHVAALPASGLSVSKRGAYIQNNVCATHELPSSGSKRLSS